MGSGKLAAVMPPPSRPALAEDDPRPASAMVDFGRKTAGFRSTMRFRTYRTPPRWSRYRRPPGLLIWPAAAWRPAAVVDGIRSAATRLRMNTRVSFALFQALLPVLAFVAASLGGQAPAGAADKVDRLVQEGLELRRNGDDQGAYPLLMDAYGMTRSPRAAAQLGFCEQALGRWADAEVHLSEALKATADPWIRKNRDPIVQSLATVKTHIARIEVVGEPTGSEVSINGAVVGHLPMTTPARVAAGEIVVEIRMAGYARASKTLQVVGGQYQKVLLRAEPERGAVSAGGGGSPSPSVASREMSQVSAGGAGGGGAAATGTGSDPLATPPDGNEETGRRGTNPDGITRGDGGEASGLRIAAWVTGGAALAALGFGVFEVSATAERLDKFKTAMADSGTRTCGTDLPDFGGARCSGLYDDWNSSRKLSIAGFVAGGVLAAASITLFLVSANRTPDRSSVAMGCAPDVHGVGLSCVARF
jgi:hypothetical protein